jgi:hypothetical protein
VTLGERWNGTSWSLQTTSNPTLPPNPVNQASLGPVACPSSSLCLAAGYDVNAGAGFAERWNGTSWSILSNAAQGKLKLAGQPQGVACVSTSSCLAVGSKSTAGASVATVQPLYLSGSSWFMDEVSVPAPEGASDTTLNGVACRSETLCFAVGNYVKSGKLHPFAVSLKAEGGGSWTVTKETLQDSEGADLRDVSCPSSTSCTAVGASNGKTFAERWNGSSWSISSTPNPEGVTGSLLRGVSCSSASACTAVGSSTLTKEGKEETKPLVLRWNGSSWSIQTTPTVSGAKGFVDLNDVACAASSNCLAIGSYVSAVNESLLPTEEKTLALSWNGSEWSLLAPPNPEGRKLSRFNGLSCSSTTACTAVGVGRTSSSSAETVTLGERYQ